MPAGLLFYVLTSDFLGFHIAAALAMLGWLLVFGMKPLPALALAIVFPVVMHLAFYKILRVPLPWGVLAERGVPMTAEVLAQAFALVFDPYVLWVVVGLGGRSACSSARYPASPPPWRRRCWCRPPSSCRRSRPSPRW